ncbi:MAG: hypothetical protein ACOYVK_20530 [Bacillota bacterium]
MTKLIYANELAEKVSFIYIKNYEPQNIEYNYKVIPMIKNDDLWEVDVNLESGTPYRFEINDSFSLVDPYALKNIFIQGKSYWSAFQPFYSEIPSLPIVEDICICKELNEHLEPVEVVDIITPLDTRVLCWIFLTEIKKNIIVSMVWRNHKKVYTAGDMHLEYIGTKTRKVFMGIEIGNILESNYFEQGDCFVDIYVNGNLEYTTIFRINKLQNYSNKVNCYTKFNVKV